jgi:membrane-associated protease RseP (regulator of RpoE activity)
MDIQTIGAIIFFTLLSILIVIHRKKFQIEKILFPFLYVVMHRTKVGLTVVDRFVKRWGKLVRGASIVGIVIGFIGMVLMAGLLLNSAYNVFVLSQDDQGVGLVLPFKTKGGVYVPFFYWIISLSIIAFIHEFGHAMVSRAFGIKVKSSGLAVMCLLIPIIPAAFVEPDEKQLSKASAKKQLAVFAAGPFMNMLLAGLSFLIILAIINPLTAASTIEDGVVIKGIANGTDQNMTFTAQEYDFSLNEKIIGMQFDGESYSIKNMEELETTLDKTDPGESVVIETNQTNRTVILSAHPENENDSYLGVSLAPSVEKDPQFIEKYSIVSYKAIEIFSTLFFWLFVLNFGIGLFNLLPLGIVDGGRMLDTALSKVIKNQDLAKYIWSGVSLFYLVLILGLVFSGFL